MSLTLASPSWPAEGRNSGGRLRRLVLVSLLAHGVVVLIWPGIRPFSPAGESQHALRLELSQPEKPASPVRPPPAFPRPTSSPLPRNTGSKGTAPAPAIVEESARISAAPAAAPEASPGTADLLARSKAEINNASRRQMLDPMFAPARQPATKATALARATAQTGQAIEEIGDNLLRVTSANGQRYCLQKLPEIATRDIPGPLLSVPMNCP